MAVKKLIEVALPLDAINEASAREKSIRHGHPSTLHLWWARRPLAAARAVIWASLVDDPSSHPEKFPTEEEQTRERERLFRILEELVVWENSNDQRVLGAAKAEIRKCMGDDLPPLLDPFAGGGAIPLEAQRLGLEAHAHDLNPVAVTINKAMIEIPPRFAGMAAVNPDAQANALINTWEGNAGLAADVEYYGNWMRDEAYRRIGCLYPKVKVSKEQGGEATVVAWLWARTVKCPNPACGCFAPLLKSRVLSKKEKAYIEPLFEEDGSVSFKVHTGSLPKNSETVSRKGAVCIKCNQPISFQYIREEGNEGRLAAQLIGIVAEGNRKKFYLSASKEHFDVAKISAPEGLNLGDLAFYPGYVNPPAYGFESIESIFTNRQLVLLDVFCKILEEAREKIRADALRAGLDDDGTHLSGGGRGAMAYSESVALYLAFAIDRLADRGTTLCGWDNGRDGIRNTFGLAGMSMSWDYAEANPFSNSSGCFLNALEWVVRCIKKLPSSGCANVRQFDAQSDCGLRNIIVSTDPPYYSNVPYADFADFFYVWLRRNLRETYPKLFNTLLTPKHEELVADPHREERGVAGARDFFEEGMYHTFQQVSAYVRDDVPVTIYYAFKQSEAETSNEAESVASTGWETMLSAIIRSGFSIVGTWPVRTELANRSRGIGSNALASSIVLVCRKRDPEAPMCTRRDFVSALKRELKPALDKLQTSNIAPVDLAQSAIGPGIGVYSRFSKVLEADGSEMTVRSALQIINLELDIYFSDQDGDIDKDSRFCVDLYTQCAFNDIRFGEADVLARAKNTSIEGLAAKGVLTAEKGIVHLKPREEIDEHVSATESVVWLLTQQLTRAMETGGVSACATILKDMFGANVERAKALAYRLFTLADKKGWNAEAFAYNNLVVAWPEIQTKVAQLAAQTPKQDSLFDEI